MKYWIYHEWPEATSDKFNISRVITINHEWYFSILFWLPCMIHIHKLWIWSNNLKNCLNNFILSVWLKKNISINTNSGKTQYFFSIIHSKLEEIIKSHTSWYTYLRIIFNIYECRIPIVECNLDNLQLHATVLELG